MKFKIFDKVLGLFSQDMGIDLGTCNTVVCTREGIVLFEPSVVAVKKGTNRVLDNGMAVGLAAKEMLGKTHGGIQAVRPMKDGVIADFDLAEAIIRYLIHKVHKGSHWTRPRMVIAVPSGITAVEKRAVLNAAERAGARTVYLAPEPLAAGIGVGLPIQEPRGSMVCDIGGGTSEIAVLSLGGIVTSSSIRIAGDEMDEAIVQHIKETYSLLVGEQTCEKIKIEIGSAYPLEQELSMDIRGRDTVSGMPRKVTIRSEEIREALAKPVHAIIRTIRTTLETTPPELSADLVDSGIVICGGGSQMRNMDRAIMKEIEIPVKVADEPMAAVARGTALMLDNLDKLKDSLECGEDIG
jgi:rod shape-determining protein MreB